MRSIRILVAGASVALAISLVACEKKQSEAEPAPAKSQPVATREVAAPQQAPPQPEPERREPQAAAPAPSQAQEPAAGPMPEPAGDEAKQVGPSAGPSRFADEFPSDQAYTDWVETFHEHEDYERVPRAMGYLVHSPLFEDRDYRFGAAAFYGEIFAQSDKTLHAAWEEMTRDSQLQEIVLVCYAAWFSDTPEAQQLIVRAREAYRNDQRLPQFFNDLYRTRVFDPYIQNTQDFFYREPVRFYILLAKVDAAADFDALMAVINAVHWTIAPEDSYLRPAGAVALEGLRKRAAKDEWVRSVCVRQAEQNPNRDVRRVLREMLGMPPEPGVAPLPKH